MIKRPKELAKDDTSTVEVIFHILEVLKSEDHKPCIIVLLQPTSPIRDSEDINKATKLFLKSKCDSVVSVYEVEHPPYWSFKIEEGYLKPLFGKQFLGKRSQDFEKVYMVNGAIYVSTPKTLYKYRSFCCNHTIPYIMPIERSIDIDNEVDFMLAELLVRKDGME